MSDAITDISSWCRCGGKKDCIWFWVSKILRKFALTHIPQSGMTECTSRHWGAEKCFSYILVNKTYFHFWNIFAIEFLSRFGCSSLSTLHMNKCWVPLLCFSYSGPVLKCWSSSPGNSWVNISVWWCPLIFLHFILLFTQRSSHSAAFSAPHTPYSARTQYFFRFFCTCGTS